LFGVELLFLLNVIMMIKSYSHLATEFEESELCSYH